MVCVDAERSCADPESFVRGGPTLTPLFLLVGSKFHYKRTIIGPPAKRHNNGPTLNAGLVAAIFQGIWTCIARKTYIYL